MESRSRWDVVGVLVLTALLAGGVWFFTDVYYGAFGVRVVGIVIGLGICILAVFALFCAAAAQHRAAVASVLDVQNSVIDGIARFQEGDDRGEVERLRLLREYARGDTANTRADAQIRAGEYRALLSDLRRTAPSAGASSSIDEEAWCTLPGDTAGGRR